MAAPRKSRTAKAPADLTTGSSAGPVRELTLEESLGAQIRLLRRRAELTGADLASSAGISLGMLSKIENGQISPSLSTLQSVGRALNVPLSQLFATFEEQRDCSFVKAGKGVVIERRGTKAGHEYQLLGHLLGGSMVVEPYLITLHEDARPYTSFRHQGVEIIYMLSGRVVYRHGNESYEMGPGDTLMFDCQAPHGPELLIEKPMNYLSIIVYPRQDD
ncbi:helix-turn-helix domain-containing protein [Komagataeibacter swingsii]|uniref:Helix-turn-helix transcriptional regulator n=1 Tax=Komagataeibacter swingsii TaxID=215220 RepID=A0A850P782_9PROT|nr:XRE family transcriptional regulator [Komagataeibacter swingsii]AHI24053.1 transcriptional regulator [Komagataeibacter xylinus E25]RFO99779.1 XRE family transcriptional regulator [Komagataeibacter xylinus]AHI25524.1 transcriptional regulator [Komagataeibacter xylinus E25]NVN36771.1 helix-turn-helix transcriptional regulator [Komagataeibacter swingsii]RFP06209.1 XRE family transcriptional regulator [Komagataeibacter xylinus]